MLCDISSSCEMRLPSGFKPIFDEIQGSCDKTILPSFDTTTSISKTLTPCLSAIKKPISEFSGKSPRRSEEHTSELQSREKIVCRLLLEKKTYRKPPKS